MDTILTWLIIGVVVGLFADLLDFYSTAHSMLMSVAYGVIGAIGGGILSQFLVYSQISFISISPLIYIILGAIVLAILPRQNKILP